MSETTTKVAEVPAAPAAEPSMDHREATTRAWQAKQAAAQAAAVEPEPVAEPEAPAPSAPVEPEAAKPTGDAVKSLAKKLAGRTDEAPKAELSPAAWSEQDTQALKRAGMRDDEAAELQALSAEKPWVRGWLEKLQKVQAKQDADFAALKQGTREPTPGSRHQPEQKQGDQPGSGQVADALDALTERFRDELGDDNATLLRQVLAGQEQRIAQLQEHVDSYTRSVAAEREEAVIEAHVQKSRALLREEFPWMDNEARFEQVASELAAMGRPESLTQEALTAAMRRAARVVFFDDVKADAAAVAAQNDSKRKSRQAATAPGSAYSNDDDEKPLDPYQRSRHLLRMIENGEPQERRQDWLKRQHELANRATRQ